MNFSKLNLMRRARELGGFFQTHYFLSAILLIGITLFGIVEIQKYLDRREVEKQSEAIEKFEADKKVSQAQTDKLLDLFEQQHGQTVSILDAIKSADDSIRVLAENDRRQDEKLINLRENYQNAKQPNYQNQPNDPVRRARVNRPLRERENDLLANDRRLYPNAGR